MITRLSVCNRTVYKKRICESLGFGARKVRFHRVKGFGAVKAKLSQCESYALAK